MMPKSDAITVNERGVYITPRIGTYTLRIMADIEKSDAENEEVSKDLGSLLNDAENWIDEELPEGYYCKIDDA
jgi:hypothetical protein